MDWMTKVTRTWGWLVLVTCSQHCSALTSFVGRSPGQHPFRGRATAFMWVWLKTKQEGLRRCWSMFLLARVPFWYRFFEPQPCVNGRHFQEPQEFLPGSLVLWARDLLGFDSKSFNFQQRTSAGNSPGTRLHLTDLDLERTRTLVTIAASCYLLLHQASCSCQADADLNVNGPTMSKLQEQKGHIYESFGNNSILNILGMLRTEFI